MFATDHPTRPIGHPPLSKGRGFANVLHSFFKLVSEFKNQNLRVRIKVWFHTKFNGIPMLGKI